jgi:hypothetical protein
MSSNLLQGGEGSMRRSLEEKYKIIKTNVLHHRGPGGSALTSFQVGENWNND